jgi:hypothetical protein
VRRHNLDGDGSHLDGLALLVLDAALGHGRRRNELGELRADETESKVKLEKNLEKKKKNLEKKFSLLR